MWEFLVLGLSINPVLLPAPTAIGSKFVAEIPTLWIDFTQTLIKGALSGYILGCGAAFLTAVFINKFDFLKRTSSLRKFCFSSANCWYGADFCDVVWV